MFRRVKIAKMMVASDGGWYLPIRFMDNNNNKPKQPNLTNQPTNTMMERRNEDEEQKRQVK